MAALLMQLHAVPQGTETCPICGKIGSLKWNENYFDEETNSSEITTEKAIEISEISNADFFD